MMRALRFVGSVFLTLVAVVVGFASTTFVGATFGPGAAVVFAACATVAVCYWAR